MSFQKINVVVKNPQKRQNVRESMPVIHWTCFMSFLWAWSIQISQVIMQWTKRTQNKDPDVVKLSISMVNTSVGFPFDVIIIFIYTWNFFRFFILMYSTYIEMWYLNKNCFALCHLWWIHNEHINMHDRFRSGNKLNVCPIDCMARLSLLQTKVLSCLYSLWWNGKRQLLEITHHSTWSY